MGKEETCLGESRLAEQGGITLWHSQHSQYVEGHHEAPYAMAPLALHKT